MGVETKPTLKSLRDRKGSLGGPAVPGKIGTAAAGLVRIEPQEGSRDLPLLVEATVRGLDLGRWCAGSQELVERKLLEHGAILFRRFTVGTTEQFQQLVQAISGGLLEYTYQSTPRSRIEGRIYTSTEYPADQAIPMHNEMSYSRSWPLKLWFYCVRAAEQGGLTPLADSRRVLAKIDPAIRERFERQGVMYIRNYGVGLDLSWQQVFQTDDRSAVEIFCRQAGIEIEWRSGGRLRTRQVCQAVARHPKLGDTVWFNQAHLFHVSSLHSALRDSLLTSLTAEELPRHSCYGDGSPIGTDALEHIRQVFATEQVQFPWRDGDVLLVDNMLTAHGRTPFSGPRKLLVGMAEPCQSEPRRTADGGTEEAEHAVQPCHLPEPGKEL